jgi:hypothetical protein
MLLVLASPANCCQTALFHSSRMVSIRVPPWSTRLVAISTGVVYPMGWMNWYG